MKYPAIALCLFAVIACSREAEVADVDTTTVSMTSVTVDTAAPARQPPSTRVGELISWRNVTWS